MTALDQFQQDPFRIIRVTAYLIHFAIGIFRCQIIPAIGVIPDQTCNHICIRNSGRSRKDLHIDAYAIFDNKELIIAQPPCSIRCRMDPEISLVAKLPDNIVIIIIFRQIKFSLHKWRDQTFGFLFGTAFEGFIQTFCQLLLMGRVDRTDRGIGIKQILPNGLFQKILRDPTHISLSVCHKITLNQFFRSCGIILPSLHPDSFRMGKPDQFSFGFPRQNRTDFIHDA